jgi:hypothetical protein
MAPSLTIGEVARRAGVAATTLRYYEQIGLVSAPARLGGQPGAGRGQTGRDRRAAGVAGPGAGRHRVGDALHVSVG